MEISTVVQSYCAEASSVHLDWNDSHDLHGVDHGTVSKDEQGRVVVNGHGYKVALPADADPDAVTRVAVRNELGAWESRDIPHGLVNIPLAPGVALKVRPGADGSEKLHAELTYAQAKTLTSRLAFDDEGNAETVDISIRSDGDVRVRQSYEWDAKGPDFVGKFTRQLETRLREGDATAVQWASTYRNGSASNQTFSQSKVQQPDGRVEEQTAVLKITSMDAWNSKFEWTPISAKTLYFPEWPEPLEGTLPPAKK